MFGFRFLKTDPTTYVIHYRNGEVIRHGAGRSFLYFAPNSSIVMIPAKSIDVPFIFEELTADFQQVSVQGQFSYRTTEPLALARVLDFTIDRNGAYQSEDPELLNQRLMGIANVLLREHLCEQTLEQALVVSPEFAKSICERFRTSPVIGTLGIEILDFAVSGVSPTKEMARALEASARESLQRQADEAIYSRRNASVNQERLIKENELKTELAVEEKKRLIRESTMAADIALEQQRAILIEQKTTNDRLESETRAHGLEAVLKPLRDTDWKVLTAAMSGSMQPELMIATAFRELAENAGKIGELNMSPELLNSLVKRK